MIRWAINTFWYKGSAENKEKYDKFGKGYIFQKIAAQTRRLIFARVATRCLEVDIE